jgi:hypothetical protein
MDLAVGGMMKPRGGSIERISVDSKSTQAGVTPAVPANLLSAFFLHRTQFWGLRIAKVGGRIRKVAVE